MCVVVSTERAAQLPKSSKGTIQRGVANEVYKEEIDRLYNGVISEGSSDQIPRRNTDEIRKLAFETVTSVTGDKAGKAPIELTTDLFSWGVNSVMATRIRTGLQKVRLVFRLPAENADKSSPSTLAGERYLKTLSSSNLLYNCASHYLVSKLNTD